MRCVAPRARCACAGSRGAPPPRESPRLAGDRGSPGPQGPRPACSARAAVSLLVTAWGPGDTGCHSLGVGVCRRGEHLRGVPWGVTPGPTRTVATVTPQYWGCRSSSRQGPADACDFASATRSLTAAPRRVGSWARGGSGDPVAALAMPLQKAVPRPRAPSGAPRVLARHAEARGACCLTRRCGRDKGRWHLEKVWGHSGVSRSGGGSSGGRGPRSGAATLTRCPISVR